MSQAALRREMVDAFADVDAGTASAATYTPPGGGAAVPCLVAFDPELAQLGEFGQSASRRLTLTFFAAEFTPVRAGTVVIDATSYTLVSQLSEEEALEAWEVRRA